MFSAPALTMKRKLFGYMFALTTLLIVLLVIGMALFGRFNSTIVDTRDSLDMQMDVFEKDVTSHFDRLAAAGIILSEDVSDIVSDSLKKYGVAFDEIGGNADVLDSVQNAVIPVLREKLLQEHCSGAFVFVDATVNPTLKGAEQSKSGVYLQVSDYQSTDDSVVMYRGNSEIGKAHGLDIHRKWHLEFSADGFPDYGKIASLITLPLDEAYYLTEQFTLPGTSDRAVLMAVPIKDAFGEFIGVCGFEVRHNYFMSHYAQITRIGHLTSMLSSGTSDVIDRETSFVSGVVSGYYREPDSDLRVEDFGKGLVSLSGDDSRYVGLCRNVSLTDNNGDYTLTVMMPRSDYDRELNGSVIRNVILWLLLAFFAVSLCRFFSRRYLAPILKGLEALKTDNHGESSSSIPEINDLFIYLAEQDKKHEKTLGDLESEMNEAKAASVRLREEYECARAEYESAKSKYTEAQLEIERLAYSRKTEVDPDNYQVFVSGIGTLTPTEKKIFEYYLSGKTVKEIIEISDIKESTLRFHNKNIYSKLGVNSLKQLLRYAAISRQTEEGDGDPSEA